MQTHIHPELANRPDVQDADRILRSCVHCGFCTAVCPTYQLLGDELDGPRGRIYLIKDLLEDNEISSRATAHLDRCLTCRSCETACPSGVEYGHLLDIGRGLIAEKNTPGLVNRIMSAMVRLVVPRPALFGVLINIGQWFKPLMPAMLRNSIPAVLPVRHYPRENAGREDAASGKGHVLVLKGCVQRSTTPNVNKAFEYLLARQGVSIEYLADEGCCGAVDYHLSAHDVGVSRMKAMIDRLLPTLERVDAIVGTGSGCCLTVKEYARVLAHDPDYAEKARRVASKVLDASEYLAQFEFNCAPVRVAFQSPCSLQHGQKLGGRVEAILTKAGLELTPVNEPHLCCGSAGTYSIMQPKLANELRDRKLANLAAGQPEVIATANVGCQLHLHALAEVPVVHWIELLADRARLLEQPPQ